MNDHYSDESKLDEASNRGYEARQIDDNLQREYEKKTEQQRRRIIENFDIQLHNHTIFRNTLFSEILLSVLESENAMQNQLKFKYIYLQIIRITTSNQYGVNVYS